MTAAVERALDDRQREATEEVERILSAAVRVMEPELGQFSVHGQR